MITINSNTRYFNVPGSDLVFGVVADSDAERKFFQCPRYVGDNLDLAACFIRINYRNANGKTDFYLVDDMVIDGDNITFSWLLSPKVTEYRGQIKFVMCAVGPDLKLKWHTTQGTGQVMEGLEPDNSHVESQTADVVAQLIAMVGAKTTAVENTGADQVAAVKAAAENARTAAVNEIEAKRANSLASIPNDYTALSGTVESLARDRAGAIVCEAEGEVITLNDASNQAFRGLRIFGKSTQDGTPTPENPVEIVSVGDGGSVGVMVCGKNLIPFPYTDGGAGTTLERNGIIWIVNADGSITANGTADASAGSYFILNPNKMFGDSTFSAVTMPNGITHAQYAISAGLYYNALTGYLSINIPSGETLNNKTFNPQIEFGVSCTDYEPYRTPKTITVQTKNGLPGIPVTSGGNYTDASGQQWICDEIDFASGVYVQRVGVITTEKLRGKYFEVNNSTNSADYNQYTAYGALSGSAAAKGTASTIDTLKALCNIFPLGCQIQHNVTQEAIWIHSDGVLVFILNKKTCPDSESAKEYILNKSLHLYYPLAENIETPLSETELAAYRALHTNKPNTTILNDSGAYMSVEYTADTKLYIDNKIKEALQ